MALLISILLALIALAALAWNFVSGAIELAAGRPAITVDGLFSSLIFATMFLIFAANTLSELRSLRTSRKQLKAQPAQSSTQAGVAVKGAPAASTVSAGSSSAPATEQAEEKEVWLDRARPVVALGTQKSARPQGAAEQVAGITRGSILVKCDAPLPVGITTQQDHLPGWKLISADAARLARAATESRLHLFYFVGPTEGSAFAFRREKAVQKALARALKAGNKRGRNALEVTQLKTRNFLGLHHASLTIQIRHLQSSPFGFEAQPSPPQVAVASAGIMPAPPEEELSTAA
ncbi:MAG: hypothetical protein ACE14M_04335 [Terriglobales bacterium]